MCRNAKQATAQLEIHRCQAAVPIAEGSFVPPGSTSTLHAHAAWDAWPLLVSEKGKWFLNKEWHFNSQKLTLTSFPEVTLLSLKEQSL